MKMLGSETFEGQYFPSPEYYIKYDVSLPENLEREQTFRFTFLLHYALFILLSLPLHCVIS